jgi:hypothetical protein
VREAKQRRIKMTMFVYGNAHSPIYLWSD